ncbi:LYR motif-containing protein 1-like [Oratosquilla oratoria]|uniref:LYR motif-containing protein 1-like n=1 Tax=Oratosquilla oratoria TaxID=337810 RepID=UPI003F763943
MAINLRSQVLSLYKKILRTGKSWQAMNPADTFAESEYVLNEAKLIFRANKNISGEQNIKQHIQEGEARLEMGIHYGTPYPRPVNMPPNTITAAWGKGNKKRQHSSRPVYLKSLDEKSPT